jgi:FkbM family methyltransferase
MTWEHVREVADLAALSGIGRLQVLSLYATRFVRRGRAPARLRRGTVYLDRRTLDSDWETLREVFVPRKNAYDCDYREAVVVDVGAHKGYFGAYALLSGARHVVSYEPDPTNYAFLARAARSFGGPETWSVRGVAVGASDGRALLHLSAESWTHSLLPLPSEAGTEEVEVIAIDSVLAEVARRADAGKLVVKIDVEGTECDLVAAASSWEPVSLLFVETHGDCTADEIASRVEPWGLVPVENRVASVFAARRTQPSGPQPHLSACA